MKKLPLAAQIYVALVIAAGTVTLVVRFRTTGVDPLVFSILAGLSSLAAVFKVRLPLARDSSTSSVSYAIDFLAVLLVGPAQAMLIASASAWSQ